MSRLQDVILRGTAASRPAAAAVAEGTLYFSTDTQITERSTGSAWESYSASAASGTVVGPAGALDQAIPLFDGATGDLLKDSGVLLTALAPKASPALTGTPTAPTAAPGTNTTQVATTAFVLANAATLPIAESDVTNLTTDLAAKAPLASPALTGTPTAPTASSGTSTTQLATTAFVHNVAPTLPIAESDVTNLTTDLAAKAPLASPALTGTPTAPTASNGTSTTQIATTAFVHNVAPTLPIAESDVTNLTTDLAAKAPLASPALTGTPTAPTATVGTNTTQLATTAFVLANAGSGGSGTVTHTVGALTADQVVIGNGAADLKTASAAIVRGLLAEFTAPVDGDFSWVNQGTAAIDTLGDGLGLTCPAGAATNIRIRKMAAPATPYTITAALQLMPMTANFHFCGLGWRQSSDGKIVTVGPVCNSTTAPGQHIASNKYSNPTTFSATYFQNPSRIGQAPVWLRIKDDGTNRICSVSGDGKRWLTIHTVGRTDFLTANEVFWFGNCENGTYDLVVTLLSWKVT